MSSKAYSTDYNITSSDSFPRIRKTDNNDTMLLSAQPPLPRASPVASHGRAGRGPCHFLLGVLTQLLLRVIAAHPFACLAPCSVAIQLLPLQHVHAVAPILRQDPQQAAELPAINPTPVVGNPTCTLPATSIKYQCYVQYDVKY